MNTINRNDLTSLDVQKLWVEFERSMDTTISETAECIFSAFIRYENALKNLNYLAGLIEDKANRVKNETNNGLKSVVAGAYINHLGELQNNALAFEAGCLQLYNAKNEYNSLVTLFAKITGIEHVLDYKISA